MENTDKIIQLSGIAQAEMQKFYETKNLAHATKARAALQDIKVEAQRLRDAINKERHVILESKKKPSA